MSFLSPERLWLLIGVAGLAAIYLGTQARRGRYAVRFTNLDLLATVAPRHPGWRRHLTALGFLGALVALVVAFAQPARAERVPVERATVIMAIDVSLSMDATDVAPSRFAAAQDSARLFVNAVPDNIELGLVAYDAVARLEVPPTTDRAAVLAGVDNLELGPGTAIGDAILVSLGAIASHQGRADGDDAAEGGAPGRGGFTDDERPVGSIVLLSDGETTAGTPDDVAIAAAAEAGVPVSTIAFGTPHGTVQLPGRGATVSVPVNLQALERIAESTDGTAFAADTAAELDRVYTDIGATVGFEEEEREVTAWFVGLALGLLGATAAGSLLWFSRLP
jgi:Ca-activated chloride channel homolog